MLLAVVTRHSTNAGIFAVALVQATNLTENLNLLYACREAFEVARAESLTLLPGSILFWVEAEICIIAVERIQEYTELEPDHRAIRLFTPTFRLLTSDLKFNNVTARYDLASETALKDLSFKIRAGDRVGIVGRTGTSSLAFT